MKNKLPPFGSLLKAFLELNVELNVCPYLFCGKDAWKESKEFISRGQLTLCLPPDKSADEYEWPVKGLKIIVYDTGDSSREYLEYLIYQLLKDGAKIVWLESSLCPIGTYFKR